MTFAFWYTPEWARYLAAYGREHAPHDGPLGNHIIPLDDSMWRRVSHGHRAAIRRGERLAEEIVLVTDRARFDMFQDLHLRDAGRVTRPQRTWDLMYEWIADGYGMLVLARYGSQFMAGIYIIKYQDGAYYAVAARHPDLDPKIPLTHALIWRAMRELRAAGYRYLDMGPIPPPRPTTEGPHSSGTSGRKDLSIAQFKREFGAMEGTPMSVVGSPTRERGTATAGSTPAPSAGEAA